MTHLKLCLVVISLDHEALVEDLPSLLSVEARPVQEDAALLTARHRLVELLVKPVTERSVSEN